ncbi:MAG: aldehyde dehydrogenase family protein [Acidobacteria bacterium]|nr:aldehyde dehydrogenase family protein [Acidobacteriota bacterium]
MAAEQPKVELDRDLASITEARQLARRAKQAQAILAECSQEQIDAFTDALAAAAAAHAEPVARLAVEETGYGVVADKIQKNLFSAQRVYQFIKPMRTVGIVNRIESTKVIEIAEPFGVVAAVVPSTNPTSTAIYKILISIKARCAIVLSPHPAAVKCITRTAEVMADAGHKAGLPDGAISWMTTVTLEGTQELMKHRDIAVILATGGMGLVRAAYSAGKPAYGVGPGNAPAYVERTADLKKAVHDVVTGKTFDNGVLCSAENAVVVDEAIAEDVRRAFIADGGHFLSPDEIEKVGKALVTPQRLPNPALVGKAATFIASKAGITVPAETRVLLAPLAGVGRDYPLSIEKLCPVLAFYVVKDWREGCERCKQILRYGGMGHTMSIHSRDDRIILEFGLKKPAFRICVNTPTTHGSIGLTTGLEPAMTLGCGGYGGNITSDNISPRHLLNIKRLAYEVRPAVRRGEQPRAEVDWRSGGPEPGRGATEAPMSASQLSDLPRPPDRPVDRGISAEALSKRIDEFLAVRGFSSGSPRKAAITAAAMPAAPSKPVDFVCEEDVREAIKTGRRIVIDDRTILTPAARDLGESKGVFSFADWRA